jgi:hypothetical protein
MPTPAIIRGMFATPKPCPKPSQGAWIGFEVEAGAEIDLVAGEVRGFQGLFRALPADPTQSAIRDTSEAFAVALTAEDRAAVQAVLDARIAALGVTPVRHFTARLDGGGISATYDPVAFDLTASDLQQIIGVVLLRARALDTMGVYAAPGEVITMTVNGVAV